MTACALRSSDSVRREEFFASLALRHCPGLGPVGQRNLLHAYGSARKAMKRVDEWKELGVRSAVVSAMAREAWRQEAEAEWHALAASDCGILLWTDPDYPALLAELPDAPILLYFRGDARLLGNPGVAVVGARECTLEGIRATAHIARGLSSAGVTVVSGLARGIDRVAHLAALEGPGSTIAVCGTGVDVDYPRSNLDLRELILEKGLILSELAPDAPGEARNFPVRNRIISGLARAVLVAEAATRSGSLNTARHALEQGREVFAVPGPVSHASSRGCQELVRKGARAAFHADDILRELVPVLKEHVALAVRERETQRTANAPDAACLAPGLLPWVPEGDGLEKYFAPASGPTAAMEIKPPSTACGLSGLPQAPASAYLLPDEPIPSAGPDAERKPGKKSKAPSSRRDSAKGPMPAAAEADEASMELLPLPTGADGVDMTILAALEAQDRLPDEIGRESGMAIGLVSARLAALEVEGAVRRLPGGCYTRRK